MNGSSPDSSNNKDWLKITDDRDALRESREHLSNLEVQHLTTVFYSLSRMFTLDDMTLIRLKRHRKEVLSRLSGYLDVSRISNSGVGAAALLCRIQENAGRDYACAVLKLGSPDVERPWHD
jgi:hypothetical protein